MNDLKNFEVVTMNDFCEISNRDILTRKPDHSLLRWAIVVSDSVRDRNESLDDENTMNKIIWTYPNNNEEEYLEQLQPKLKNLENKLGNNMGAINIDEMYEEFCGSVFECLERKPIKPISKRRLRKSKPWFNRDLWRLRKEFHGAERKWLKGKIERRKYIQSRNEYKREVEKAKHAFEKDLCAELDELEGRNPSKWWKKVKGLMGNDKYKVDFNKVVDCRGNLIEGKDKVFDIWTSHFNELLNNQDDQNNNTRDTDSELDVTGGSRGKFDELDRPLDKEEVEKAIRDVRLNAAPGQDMIIGKWVKNGVVTDFTFKFCEKCLELGQIPNAWRNGYIVPIPKGTSKGVPDPRKFRGISVLSVVYKIFCTVVKNRLIEVAESNGLLCEEQNGFRKGRGCVDNILMLSLLGSKYSKVGDGLRCGFIDLQKAYDSVNRDKLWDKLGKMGIKGKLLECMQSIYEDVTCTVKLGEECGKSFCVQSGLRQGCVLSPLLFRLYINELPQLLKDNGLGVKVDEGTKVPGLLYADDLAIFADSDDNLNKAFDVVNEWCKVCDLKVNVEKCNVIHFRRKKTEQTRCVFKIGEQIIQTTQSYKYLGVVLNEFLEDKAMISEALNKGRKALYEVIRMKRQIGQIGWRSFSKLFMSLVLPSMMYGCEVWGLMGKHGKQLERVQLTAIRNFLGVHSKFPIPALELEAGWLPIRWEIQLRAFRLWMKIERMGDNRLIKKIVRSTWEDSDWGIGIRKFALWFGVEEHEIRAKLFEGLNNYQVDSIVRSSIWRAVRGEWGEAVKNKSKLEWWRRELTESGDRLGEGRGGIVYIEDRSCRRLGAELRAGCCKLEVEMGRWRGNKRDDRICKLCGEGIEDEKHFLTICTKLDLHRVWMREEENLENLNEDEKSNMILKSLEMPKIARFVLNMWKSRKELLKFSK